MEAALIEAGFRAPAAQAGRLDGEGDSILRIARRIERPWPASRSRSGHRAAPARGPRNRPSLDGLRPRAVESRGKHLLLHFEDDLVLHSHLGMRGSWQLYREGERWRRPRSQAWIALTGNGAEAVNFGGSMMRIVSRGAAAAGSAARAPRAGHPRRGLRAGGRDRDGCGRSNPQIELGEALLGQRLVAGIGNIFKSEGCFGPRIDPHRRSSRSATTSSPRSWWRPASSCSRRSNPAASRSASTGGRASRVRAAARDPIAGAGRRCADDLLVPGLPDGLNPR